MNPEFYDYVMEKLFAAGALDVYYSSIQMKKNRPAVKINVLVAEHKLQKVIDILLEETTTLGVRIIENISRVCLKREIRKVTTPWGRVAVKIGIKGDKIVNIAPEYDDIKNIADQSKTPIKKVYNYIINSF